MDFPYNLLDQSSWLSWAFLSITFTGAVVARYLQQQRTTRIRQNSYIMAPPTASSTKSATAVFTGLAPPCVRLPQGTYEGRVVAVGQNVVESAGLGLGVGAGGSRPSTPPSASGGPLPIPQQATLPKALDVFLGIPYAQSTAGANRFRAPVPVTVDERGTGDLHSRVIPATQLGQRCPGTAPNPFIPEGEDCLNLNVYRPSLSDQTVDHENRIPSGPLPVVVYVHGGAFNNGMGVERDMASFVGYAEVDIVGVSFNYRVGALGFLGWQKATEDNDDSYSAEDNAPLNLGLRDQQALFAWVQKNIRCFGGDPNNVTIMGLSAGAHSVSLVKSPIFCIQHC
jgi:hypothetical protein